MRLARLNARRGSTSWQLLVIVASLVVLGVMLFAVPRFEKALDDWNTPLPRPLMLAINTSRWLGGRQPGQQIPGVLWVSVAVGAALCIGTVTEAHKRRAERRGLTLTPRTEVFMPTFQYEALNEAGKPQKGTITANNNEDAIARIRSQGFFPTSVREQKVKKTKGSTSTVGAGVGSDGKKDWKQVSINIGGVGQKALTVFTRQMSTLQDAGLPILRSLSILEQQKPGLFKSIIGGVHEDVSGGATLSDAMAKHPRAFDKLYTKMIAAGEVGGVLDLILQRLAEFMEKAAKLKKRIIGAMIYPAVVLSVAGLIVLGIMILIVPKFEKIFDDFGTTLPGLTVALMTFSRWIGGRLPDQFIPGIVWIILSPIGIWLGLKLARKTAGGKAFIDSCALKIPVAGKLIAKATIARFTRTLGTLISAGVPILDAINITRETTGNFVYARALGRVHDSVRQGESFAEPLRQARVCDAIVVNMIDVGEETGDLDKMLIKIADNYDEEVDVMVASLVSLLEPIMVVVLGAIVGFIVIALFLPLVKLITSLTG